MNRLDCAAGLKVGLAEVPQEQVSLHVWGHKGPRDFFLSLCVSVEK